MKGMHLIREAEADVAGKARYGKLRAIAREVRIWWNKIKSSRDTVNSGAAVFHGENTLGGRNREDESVGKLVIEDVKEEAIKLLQRKADAVG